MGLTRVGTTGLTIVGAMALTLVSANGAGAQSDDAAAKFEVASVKPSHEAVPDVRFSLQPGGRFGATNVPVFELIRSAYGVSQFQIVDAPDWTRSERFDIVAKAPGSPGPADVFLMLRELLAQRFHLAVHHEQREMPVYALMKIGDSLGPRLRPAAADCATIMAGVRRGQAPPSSPRVLCGTRMRAGQIEQGGRTLDEIAASFTPVVGSIVVDRTGLKGLYDLDLDFAPEPSPGNPAPSQTDAPSIFTALREQLGLKLERTRTMIDVLVVDHVERPTTD